MVRERLGSGGMAVVYRAEDTLLGRDVAIKTLHRRYAEMPAFRRRFRQEARAMASLDHQNIVKVYDISPDGEAPFIVEEYVGGRDLGSLLSRQRGGRLEEPFAVRVAVQLLKALAYAHWRGVIHRDIKPSNILITPGGIVKVADFGIARLVEEDGEGDGEIIGSARYMSPEQLRGLEATQRSDVYSVGVLLYHCLTGRPPFSGDVRSLVRQHLREAPRPPRELNRGISPQMEAVILRAMAKDPEARYPSATAMLDEIEEGARQKARSGTREMPRRRMGRGRLALVSTLAVLLLGGGTAVGASGLAGYVDLSPRSSVGQAVAAEPLRSAPPGIPEVAGQEASRDAPLVPVPDVRPYFDYSAREILVNRGFKVRIVYAYREGYANRGVAWGTDPPAGTLAPAGSTVTVYSTPKDLYQPQIRTAGAAP
ncbi:protein kinase domain-containing protein [Rubrobacter xylanophilus]|uniref:protein kinase domain-containing protein n=1 Tax=Rubrobacter xylanophilus TaxID=49319 RepID=UPI00003A1DC1|nr:protein kinase [Rubrobacter xylanophilus]